MILIKRFFVSDKSYYHLEHHPNKGYKAVIKAGYMNIVNWYNENTDIESILNHAEKELKFRIKTSLDYTVCHAKTLLNLVKNRNQLKLEL